jgi:hypothetical protein
MKHRAVISTILFKVSVIVIVLVNEVTKYVAWFCLGIGGMLSFDTLKNLNSFNHSWSIELIILIERTNKQASKLFRLPLNQHHCMIPDPTSLSKSFLATYTGK